jgi:hypothetical protein
MPGLIGPGVLDGGNRPHWIEVGGTHMAVIDDIMEQLGDVNGPLSDQGLPVAQTHHLPQQEGVLPPLSGALVQSNTCKGMLGPAKEI